MMRKVMKIEAGGDRLISSLKLRTAAYCRVSTDNDGQLLSLEAQKQHYEKIIRDNPEWEFAGLYCDEGISGTKKENREGFLRLLQDCEKHKIDFIITKSISRFARNTADCLEIVRRFSELGIYIFFEKENINTRSMDSELLLSVLSSLAENESVSISQNNKWGIKRRFQSGTFKLANPPYGYMYQNETIVPHPEQAAVVKRIFAEILAGRGTHAVAEGLNADGINPARGKKWTASAVRGILENEKYVGDALFQKTYTDDNFIRHYNHGEEEMYYIKDHHEAIISREDFEAAKRILEQRGREKGIEKGTGKYLNRYVFSGRIICGECGSVFKRRIHMANKPGQYVAWCCSKHIASKTKDCSMVYIRDDRIKAAFVLMMNKLFSNHSIILKPLIEALKEQDASGFYAKIKEIDAKIEENAERAQILVSFLTKGYLDPVLFNKQNNEIKAETARLREQRAALAASSAGGRSALSEAEALLKYLSKEGGIIEEFDEFLFERFVEGITVFSPAEIGFRMKCGLVLRERIER